MEWGSCLNRHTLVRCSACTWEFHRTIRRVHPWTPSNTPLLWCCHHRRSCGWRWTPRRWVRGHRWSLDPLGGGCSSTRTTECDTLKNRHQTLSEFKLLQVAVKYCWYGLKHYTCNQPIMLLCIQNTKENVVTEKNKSRTHNHCMMYINWEYS